MSIFAANGLHGTDGVQPTSGSIAATGDSPTFFDDTRLLYDNTHLIRTRVPIQSYGGYGRNTTGRLRYDLPPTGPWSARWYVWVPDLQAAGHGIDEVRWHVAFPDQSIGYVIHTTAGGNIGVRLQPDGLAQSSIIYDTIDGSAVATNQLLRVEFFYDGTDLHNYVYAGDDTVSPRIFIWENRDVGRTLELTAYRYRRGVLLQQGDTDASTGGLVTPRQQQLITLGYLDPGDDDGIYGAGTAAAVSSFQTDFSISPVDGEIGPETGAGMDLAVDEAESNPLPEPLWYSNFVITDDGTTVGPLDPESVTVGETLQLNGAVVAEDTTTVAHETLEFNTPAPTVAKNAFVSPDETLQFDGNVTVSKSVDVDASETLELTTDTFVIPESQIAPPPPVPPRSRLVVYDPAGAIRGILPYPLSWQASVPMNDVGSMTMSYSSHAPGANLLEDVPFEIALELNNGPGTSYVEPPGCRFLSIRRTRDLKDRSGVFTWTLVNYAWMLRKGKVIENLVDGERDFVASNVGDILRTLYDEAVARTNFDGLAVDFTDTLDSDGNAWSDTFDVTYGDGASYHNILDAFVEELRCDWRTEERTLRIFNPDTVMLRDREQHVIRLTDCLEAPETLSYEDLATRTRVRGDSNNAATGVRLIGGEEPWGRWEQFLQAPGITDGTQLLGIASNNLDQVANSRSEITRRVVIGNTGPLVNSREIVPLIDYLPGDEISVEEGDLSLAVRRVRQITMGYAKNRAMEADIILENRIIPREIRWQRSINRTLNSADRVVGSGGFRL